MKAAFNKMIQEEQELDLYVSKLEKDILKELDLKHSAMDALTEALKEIKRLNGALVRAEKARFSCAPYK